MRNHLVSKFLKKVSFQITVGMLNQLIGKIRGDLPNLEGGEEADQISQHFNNTLARLRDRMESPESDGLSYEGLVL